MTRTWILFGSIVLVTIAVLALLVNIFRRQQEARITYRHVVEIPANEPDPAVWGANFPNEYDSYQRTLKTSTFAQYSKYGRYGGSENFSKLHKYPNITRLFAGYPFSVEYREERGHLHAVADMLATKRLGDKKPGPCMTWKSSQVPGIMAQIGPEQFYRTPVKQLVSKFDIKHSISCADCHQSGTMALQVTRPAFREAMERRKTPVPTANHQQMRAYVCGQCHVEYYWPKETNYLTFPWDRGMRLEQIEEYYDRMGFSDWTHAETGAKLVKMQHPDYELWSSGIHARAGVSCPDCHMPFKREGSIKVTDHWIATPLADVARACTTCHRASEAEMRARVLEIQDRTYSLLSRAEEALIAAIDGIKLAIAAGATDAELEEPRRLHRRAHLRWDFISAENSMGFHSGGEANRILGDAIDFARQAELAAYKVMAARQGGTRR